MFSRQTRIFAFMFTSLFSLPWVSAEEGVIMVQDGLRGDLGLGVQVGEPFMLTAKYWGAEGGAVQLGAGSFGANPGLILTLDALRELVQIGRHEGGVSLGLHAGLGLGIGLGEGHCYRSVWRDRSCGGPTTAALRVPLGLNLYLADTVELFIEAVPTVAFLPGVYGGWGGGLGGRLYL